MNNIICKKLVLLGDSAVGKSSIINMYIKKKFSLDEVSTIGAMYHSRKINIDNKILKLDIWDTAGQERFNSLVPLYYRNSDIILLVYDVNIYSSLLRVIDLYKEVVVLSNNPLIILVGNKIDLSNNIQQVVNKADEFAKEHNIMSFKVSAKNNIMIDELFQEIIIKVPKEDTKKNNFKNINLYENKDKTSCCYLI